MMAEYISYAVLYLAEAMIAWFYLDALLPRRTSVLRAALLFALGYGGLFFVTWFDSVPLNAAAFFLVNLLLAMAAFRCKFRFAALHSAFLTSIMAITEVIAAWAISLFGFPFAAYTQSLAVMIVMAVISKLLYFFIALLAAKLFSRSSRSREAPAFTGLLCILPVLSIAISTVVVFVGSRAEMTKPVEILMITIVLTLLAVNLIFVMIYNHLQRLHAEHMAQSLSLQREEADAAYYRDLQAQSEAQRILIHDIKNHLNTLHALAADAGPCAVSDYIETLGDTFLPTQQLRLCSEPVLNFMLLQFRERCAKREITFQCDIRDDTMSFPDAPSMTTFFGNLLSNAMEAAEASQERWIELSVTKSDAQQVVMVSVVNSCDAAPLPEANGLFRTGKKNPEIHGVGLKSIRRVVAQYHGVDTMRFDPAAHRFYHIIQFPFRTARTVL